MKLDIIYVRVGKTRSGKVIPYSCSVVHIEDIVKYFEESYFSSDDLLDVFAVFDYLALRGRRREDESIIFGRYAERAMDLLGNSRFDIAKSQAKIKSAFDLRDLGRSLVSVEFSDF